MINKIKLQERNILIVPIGLEIDRVIEGFKLYPINVIYLLHNPTSTSTKFAVEKYSKHFADKVKNRIKSSFNEINSDEINLGSFHECFVGLNNILKKEKQTKNLKHIYINVSTASKIFAIASYIFACRIPKLFTLFYLRTNNYILLEHLNKKESSLDELNTQFMDSGLTKGDFEIEEIPILKSQEFTKKEGDILKIFNEKSSFNSLLELIKFIPMKNNPGNRMKTRRILYKLEDLGLIKTEKIGKELNISATKKYGLMSEILEITE